MNKLIFYAFLTCTLFQTDVSGVINHRPLNAATSVGGQTVFNCSSDATASITWLYTTDCNTAINDPLTDSNCNIISNHASHYRTEKSGFVCNLIVFDALLSLGGCFTCFDGFGAGGQYQAMLVIIDSNATTTPNSTDIIPGEDVMISTSVSYGGPSIPLQPPPLPPSFYWTLQSDPSQNITSYPGLATETSASSYIIVAAQSQNVPPYICNLFFNLPINVSTSIADNAPIYSKSWATPNYPVSYRPENISISGYPIACPYDDNLVITLVCSASGHPSPGYTWFELTSDIVLSDISTVTIKKDGIYQCNASNTIRSVKYYASTVANVSDCLPDDDPSTSSTCDLPCIVGLVIAIYFGLNLLFFLIFIICYGCSKNGRNTLNDRFPWLEKMLPCMNDEGCECSMWIFYFVILSIFAAFIFFPVILIMASCCKKTKKNSQGNRQESERNVRGAGGTQLNTLGTTPYQYPPRVSVTSNPPSSLNTSANFQQDQTDRPYRPSSTQQHQPTYWGNSDPYPPNPRNLQMPRQTPSPALSSGGVVYADLRVDNQPKSRRPIQPIQNDANTYADIAMA